MPYDATPLLDDYEPSEITVATVTSHSSLQIFDGARKEGFDTLGITQGEPPRFYDAYPRGKPDDFLALDEYADIEDHVDDLVDDNTILVPHGSVVEYLGADRFAELEVPTFGNRRVLEWESDRDKEREWLTSAGITMPREIEDPKDIVRPCIVKYHGAKGGKGFFICKNYQDYKQKVDADQPHTIQEFVLGTRYYLHYFFSPIRDDGYRVLGEDGDDLGQLQMLSVDRRDETNIDEANRLGSIADLEYHMGITPTFVVTGNFPLVMRESLLEDVFTMGERVVEESLDRFGGVPGSFCLETVVTDDLEFKVFEISARIVAGTNPYITGSPYSDLIQPDLSTGRRIGQEIELAAKRDELDRVCS
jgi:5-formaminoimidazole-4-carboxamide-1-(beta)-D-ribofuranosyl 5'-monophosphate synthetase